MADLDGLARRRLTAAGIGRSDDGGRTWRTVTDPQLYPVTGLTATSEMCAAMNQYAYPADKLNSVPPMLGTTVFANATPSMLTNTAKSAIPLF